MYIGHFCGRNLHTVIRQKVWIHFFTVGQKVPAHFLNPITILKIQIIKKTKFSKIETL